MNMRLLVTGGAGFIGSNFVRRSLNGIYEGIETITVLDKLTYAGNLDNLKSIQHFRNFKFVQGDICDSRIIESLLRSVDAVVNFAAESHVDRSISGSDNFISTNISGVATILDAIKKSNLPVKFIQVSTDEVYGSILSGSWNEECPLQPNSPYSATKASGELLCRAYTQTFGIETIITRSSNNYGPFQFPEKLIPLFVTNLLKNRRIPLYGSGLNVRDWLHVDDHCDGVFLVLKNGKAGETYNIGGGQELTNLEITSKILGLMDQDFEMVDYVDDRKGHDYRYSIDWSKIKNELGYLPKIDFSTGLTDTILWYQENEAWWANLKNELY
jgi:dTDP-glucose 4,6-dehydratase